MVIAGIRPLAIEPFIAHCLQMIDGYEREDQGELVDGDERTERTVQLVTISEMLIIG